jgi:hypothetical protein
MSFVPYKYNIIGLLFLFFHSKNNVLGLIFHHLLTIFLLPLQVCDFANVCFAKCVVVTVSFANYYFICLLLDSFW